MSPEAFNKEIEKEIYQAGYEQALNDIARRDYANRLQGANEDPTGQDLDDFLERNYEPDDYSHVECPIQRAEMRFGA